MKYGERLYALVWHRKGRGITSFRYRIDPVPYIRNGKGSYFKCWYKTPKTYQERRWSFADEEYVRKKRNSRNLPNPWDDYPRADTYIKRSWKKIKCKKQWMKRRNL